MDLNTNLEDYPKRFKMAYEKNLVNLRKIFYIWIGKISRKNFNNINFFYIYLIFFLGLNECPATI